MSNDFNIKIKDVKFIVNKEKRTVVCYLPNAEFLFTRYATTHFDKILTNSDDWFLASVLDRYKMQKRYTAIARCHPEDEWSEEIGKMVAFSHLKDNVCRAFFRRATRFIDEYDAAIDNAVAQLNDLGRRLEANADNRHERIRELVGEPK